MARSTGVAARVAADWKPGLIHASPSQAVVERHGPQLLLGFVLLHLAVWTVVPWLGQWTVPVDNYEQLSWVQHVDWGYAKHPPFPTWVLAFAELILPHGVPLTYALGAVCTGFMLWTAWRLGDELLGRKHALMVVLLICGITYYTSHVRYFNHNTLLMVAHAGATLCVWRCANGSRNGWWLLLGLLWGIGMLSKYQMALSIGCNVCFLALLARDPRHHGEVRSWFKGVLVASVVCGLMLMPHAIWLVHNDFTTFGYASHSMAANQGFLQRLLNILEFIGHHFGRVLPMLIIAVALLWLGRKQQLGFVASEPVDATDGRQRDAALLLQIHAFAPFVLMVLLTLMGGVALQIHWGTAYLWLTGLWFMSSDSGRKLARLPIPWLFAGLLLVQAFTLIQYAHR
jgi:4-amino-4-deoxy-L-arabinose transferase-like glycosyltransferase